MEVSPTIFGNYTNYTDLSASPRFRDFRTRKKQLHFCNCLILKWELRESNPRPSACKADALNQLS